MNLEQQTDMFLAFLLCSALTMSTLLALMAAGLAVEVIEWWRK
jgi:hypothetical protein